MLDDLAHREMLKEFRGEPPVDRTAVTATLLALSQAAQETPGLVSVDLNPIIISNGLRWQWTHWLR